MKVGIDKIAFYTPKHYLDLSDLARTQGVSEQKYHVGIGQEAFSVPAHDEDVVTMAAAAADMILDEEDIACIDTVFFATESGIDQSKAAGIYVHSLLGLKANCRVVELKQACYSATFALQMAVAYVRQFSDKKVLVIASDISRYALGTPAEATQGAAAVALLISSAPRVATIEGTSGLYTQDVMDFWRPNDHDTPLVDGKFSTQVYLKATQAAWLNYQEKNQVGFADFAYFCYHLPFSKMGVKAHQMLARLNGVAEDVRHLPAMAYGRSIGNAYTASLYLALCSLLDAKDDLAGALVGMLSYGSGCVAEFFALRLQEDYLKVRQKACHENLLRTRRRLSFDEYLHFWHRVDGFSSGNIEIEDSASGKYRLQAIRNYQRIYCKS